MRWLHSIGLILFCGVLYAQPETIDIGSSPNAGDGDPLRTAFQKVNTNDAAAFDSVDVHRGEINTNKVFSVSESTAPGSGAYIPIKESGANYKTSKHNLQKGISDSTYNQEGRLTATEEYLEGLQIWDIDITDDGDSLQFTFGDNIFKVATGSKTVVDRTPPEITSAEVGNVADDSLIIVLDEDIVTDSIPATTAFAITIDDVAVTVSSLAVYTNSIHLKLASSLDSTQYIAGRYTPPGTGRIQDASGNYLKSTSFTITNNTKCTQVGAFAHFRFENNTVDQQGNLSMVNNAAYESGGNLIEGSYSAHLNSANYHFRTASVDLGDLFVIAIRWRIWFGTSNERTLFSWLDEAIDGNGLEFRYDRPNDILEVETSDGSNVTTATSSVISYSSNTNTWSAIAVDRASGAVKIYHEGVDVTSSGSIQDDFDNVDSIFIGIQKDLSGEMYGYADDVQIYKDTLPAASMLSIYNSPGNSVTYGECNPDPPPPADSITVYKWLRFDNVVLDEESGTLRDSLTSLDFFNVDNDFHSLQGEDNGIAEEAEFRAVSGDTVVRSIYKQGNCCQETSSGVLGETDGTGFYTEWWIDAGHSDFEHGHLFFRVFFPTSFNPPTNGGGKLPGLRSVESSWASSGENGFNLRLIYKGITDNGVDVMPYCRFYDSGGTPIQFTSGGIFTSITRGEWHDVVYRFWAGTANTSNGFFEVFIDGQLIKQWTSLYMKKSSSISINRYEIATFAGGDSHGYDMPNDTYMDIDDVIFFQFDEDYSQAPAYNVPSSAGRTLNLTFDD